jgi:hypothetical protein
MDLMEKCNYYKVETRFVRGLTYIPVIEKTCTHPNVVQLFGTQDIKKIKCDGDASKCILSSTH